MYLYVYVLCCWNPYGSVLLLLAEIICLFILSSGLSQ
jgi:hypothetical protein